MKTLIFTEIQLLKSKLRFIEKKYIYVVAILCMLLLALLGYIVYAILNPRPDLTEDVLNNYVFFIVGYICLISMPMEVYETFVENKQFDILFLSPLSLKVCFIWNYLKKIVPILLVGIIALALFVPLMIKHNVLIISYCMTYILLILTIYTLYIFLEMVAYFFLGNKLHKFLIALVSLEEIAFFFIIFEALEGKTRWVKMFDFTELIYNNSVCFFIFGLCLLGGIAVISYHIFKNSYYRQGCCNRKNGKSFIKMRLIGSINNLYYLAKDEKVFISDIDRLKYIIVTCIIFIFSSFIDAQEVGGAAVLGAVLSFAIIMAFQCSYENIVYEKEKYDVLALAGISFSSFALHKTLFAILNTTISTMVYGLCLILKNGLGIAAIAQISVVIVPIVFFSCFYMNFEFSCVFTTIVSDRHFFEKMRKILKRIIAMLFKIGIISLIYVCLYFIEFTIEVKIICWVVFSVVITLICRRRYKKGKYENLLTLI